MGPLFRPGFANSGLLNPGRSGLVFGIIRYLLFLLPSHTQGTPIQHHHITVHKSQTSFQLAMATPQRIPTAEWDSHKDTISTLYLTNNKTLDEVITHMGDTYGFHAT